MAKNLFEGKEGTLVRCPGRQGTPAMLDVKVPGYHIANTVPFILTNMTINEGTNSSISYSMDGGIFITMGSDTVGSLTLSGMALGELCGAAATGIHSGFETLQQIYQHTRVSSSNDRFKQALANSGEVNNLPRVTVSYNSALEPITGYVNSYQARTADFGRGIFSFTLTCYVVPFKH